MFQIGDNLEKFTQIAYELYPNSILFQFGSLSVSRFPKLEKVPKLPKLGYHLGNFSP